MKLRWFVLGIVAVLGSANPRVRAAEPATRTVDVWAGGLDDQAVQVAHRADGKPYIVYSTQDGPVAWRVRLARWSGADWSHFDIASALVEAPSPRFAISAAGLGHVVFVDARNNQRKLRYVQFDPATYNGNPFLRDEVVSQLAAQLVTLSMDLQSNGEPAVAWDNFNLQTTWSKRGPANWGVVQLIAPCTGGGPSLQIESTAGGDRALVACRQVPAPPQAGNWAVLLREQPGGGWAAPETVFPAPGVPLGNEQWTPTLGFVAGQPRVVAHDTIRQQLWYAEPDPGVPLNGNWTRIQVVDAGNFPAAPRVAVTFIKQQLLPNVTTFAFNSSTGYWRDSITRFPFAGGNNLMPIGSTKTGGDCLTAGSAISEVATPDGKRISTAYVVGGSVANPGFSRLRFATDTSPIIQDTFNYPASTLAATGSTAATSGGTKAICYMAWKQVQGVQRLDIRVRVTEGDGQREYLAAAGLKEPAISARTCALSFAPNGDLAVLYGYATAPAAPPPAPANGVALRILPAGAAEFGPAEQVWDPADGPSTTTQYVDAKYDQGGTLHLAYAPLLGAGRQVRYARRPPGGPVGGFEHPGIALGEGEYVSMGLSGIGSGDVWLSWGGVGGVLVARRLPAPVGGGWVWSLWLVDELGSQPDIAVRQLQNGTVKAVVAYHRSDVADLYLATMGQPGDPSGWATGLPIDKPGSTGLEPSVELNGQGEPIVAYGIRDANGARWEKLAYSGPFESRKLVGVLWVPSPGWNLCTFAASPGGYNSNLALDEFDTFHASHGIAQPLKKFDFGTLERP